MYLWFHIMVLFKKTANFQILILLMERECGGSAELWFYFLDSFGFRWKSWLLLAWRTPGTGEPGGLPSMGSHRVGHN